MPLCSSEIPFNESVICTAKVDITIWVGDFINYLHGSGHLEQAVDL